MHFRLKLEAYAALAHNTIFAFSLCVVLVTLLATSAKVQTLTHPIFFYFLLVLWVKVVANIDLNCVVARGERFYIPFDEIVFLTLLNIVQVVYHEKSYKDGRASNTKRKLFSCSQIEIRHHAAHLNEHKRFI